jgi:hypothetical protein
VSTIRRDTRLRIDSILQLRLPSGVTHPRLGFPQVLGRSRRTQSGRGHLAVRLRVDRLDPRRCSSHLLLLTRAPTDLISNALVVDSRTLHSPPPIPRPRRNRSLPHFPPPQPLPSTSDLDEIERQAPHRRRHRPPPRPRHGHVVRLHGRRDGRSLQLARSCHSTYCARRSGNGRGRDEDEVVGTLPGYVCNYLVTHACMHTINAREDTHSTNPAIESEDTG